MSAVGVKNLYDVLGASRGATQEELKQAYRNAQKRIHPDVRGDAATDEAAELNNAYEILGDPDERRSYDAWLSRGNDYSGFDLYCPHCKNLAHYVPDLNLETNVLRCQSGTCFKLFVVRYINCSILTPFHAGPGRSRYLVSGEAVDGTDRHVEFEGPVGITASFNDVLLLLYPSEASSPVILQSSATGRKWDLRSADIGSAPQADRGSAPAPPHETYDAPPPPDSGPQGEMTMAMMLIGAWRQIHGGLVVAGLAGWWLTHHYVEPVFGRFVFTAMCTVAAAFAARAKGRRMTLWAVVSFFTDGVLAFVLFLMPTRTGNAPVDVRTAFSAFRARLRR